MATSNRIIISRKNYVFYWIWNVFLWWFCTKQNHFTKHDAHFTTDCGSDAEFKLDTITPPEDKTTKLAMELRELKGGFNINEFLQFKMKEENQKPENDTDEFRKVTEFFTVGKGKKTAGQCGNKYLPRELHRKGTEGYG